MGVLKRRFATKPVEVDEEIEEAASDVEELQKDKPKNPLSAIRSMCLTCMEGSHKRVTDCGTKDCPCHHFRFGKNPFRKNREMSPERKAQLVENLKKAREKRAANEASKK